MEVNKLQNRTLALHKTLELHELIQFKNLCLTKSTTMSGLVQDQELKSILGHGVAKTKQELERLHNFL
jgi:similar to spore coat protein